MIERLPITGFVLAGGRSSRMGVDKASLRLGDRTLLEVALEKLGRFCETVSISGGCADLAAGVPIVQDLRAGAGPGGAVEACLEACRHEWALFLPVDAPLVPSGVLQCWAASVMEHHREVQESSAGGVGVSYLRAEGRAQPAFCMVRREVREAVRGLLDGGERKLRRLFDEIGTVSQTTVWPVDAEDCTAGVGREQMDRWFLNANTPEDWEILRAAAQMEGV